MLNHSIDQSINEYMVEKSHAVEYFGQSKEDIEKEHLENRNKLKADAALSA